MAKKLLRDLDIEDLTKVIENCSDVKSSVEDLTSDYEQMDCDDLLEQLRYCFSDFRVGYDRSSFVDINDKCLSKVIKIGIDLGKKEATQEEYEKAKAYEEKYANDTITFEECDKAEFMRRNWNSIVNGWFTECFCQDWNTSDLVDILSQSLNDSAYEYYDYYYDFDKNELSNTSEEEDALLTEQAMLSNIQVGSFSGCCNFETFEKVKAFLEEKGFEVDVNDVDDFNEKVDFEVFGNCDSFFVSLNQFSKKIK